MLPPKLPTVQRPPLTYEEFLAMQGKAPQQVAKAPQSAPQSVTDKAIEQLLSSESTDAAKTTGLGSLFSGGTSAATGGASTTFSSGSVVAGEVLGSAPGGGSLMSTGVIVPASEGVPMASGAFTAGAPAAGMFDLAGVGSVGNAIAPIGGALLAGDVLMNKRHGLGGAAEGAAAGALIGSAFGGAGAVPGYVIGGALGGLGGYFGNFGDKNAFQKEAKRAQKLRDQGLNWNYNATIPKAGRSKQQLIEEAKANGGNVKFAESRNEGDLVGTDLVGYAALPEKLGADYANASLDKQTAAAQAILDAKAAREHHGTIDVNWNPELEARVRAILGGKPQPAGQTAGQTAAVTRPTFGETPSTSSIPRSKTLSPGIGLDGKPTSWRK